MNQFLGLTLMLLCMVSPSQLHLTLSLYDPTQVLGRVRVASEITNLTIDALVFILCLRSFIVVSVMQGAIKGGTIQSGNLLAYKELASGALF